GVLGEQIPCPRQSEGGGLVTGEEQGHGLVADLPIGHAAALLVARVQQQREQVAAVGLLRAALADEAEQDRVEPADGPAKAEVRRRRQPERRRQRGVEAIEEIGLQDRERVDDDLRLAADVGVEKSLGG